MGEASAAAAAAMSGGKAARARAGVECAVCSRCVLHVATPSCLKPISSITYCSAFSSPPPTHTFFGVAVVVVAAVVVLARFGDAGAVCCDKWAFENTVPCGGDTTHFMCRGCFRRYATETVVAGGTSGVPCADPGCKAPYPTVLVRRNLSTWDVLRIEEREEGRNRRYVPWLWHDAVMLRAARGYWGEVLG